MVAVTSHHWASRGYLSSYGLASSWMMLQSDGRVGIYSLVAYGRGRHCNSAKEAQKRANMKQLPGYPVASADRSGIVAQKRTTWVPSQNELMIRNISWAVSGPVGRYKHNLQIQSSLLVLPKDKNVCQADKSILCSRDMVDKNSPVREWCG